MGLARNRKVVQNGLLLALDVADPLSYTVGSAGNGTAFRDLTANGNNAVLANNWTYDSNNGGSIQLDQVDDYITFPTGAYPSGTGDFSIDVWFYLISNLTYLGSFVNYTGYLVAGNVSGALAVFIQSAGTGTTVPSIIGFERMGGGSGFAVTGLTIPILTWHHFCITRVSGTTYLYFNNSQIGSTAILSGVSITAAPTVAIIGENTVFAGYYGYLPCRISNFRSYNRGFSQADVSQNFNATRWRFGV